jgi:hypothetical protein
MKTKMATTNRIARGIIRIPPFESKSMILICWAGAEAEVWRATELVSICSKNQFIKPVF